jgi:hypothetical protein
MQDEKREFILQVVKEILDTDPIKRPTADDIRNRFTRQMRAAPIQPVSLPSNVATSSRDNPKTSDKESDPVPSPAQPPITNESTFLRDFGIYGTTFIGRILSYIVKFLIIFFIIVFPALLASVGLFATSKSSSYGVTEMFGIILTGALAIYRGATDREIGHMILRRIVVCLFICFFNTLSTEDWPNLEGVQALVCLTVTRDIVMTIES